MNLRVLAGLSSEQIEVIRTKKQEYAGVLNQIENKKNSIDAREVELKAALEKLTVLNRVAFEWRNYFSGEMWGMFRFLRVDNDLISSLYLSKKVCEADRKGLQQLLDTALKVKTQINGDVRRFLMVSPQNNPVPALEKLESIKTIIDAHLDLINPFVLYMENKIYRAHAQTYNLIPNEEYHFNREEVTGYLELIEKNHEALLKAIDKFVEYLFKNRDARISQITKAQTVIRFPLFDPTGDKLYSSVGDYRKFIFAVQAVLNDELNSIQSQVDDLFYRILDTIE